MSSQCASSVLEAVFRDSVLQPACGGACCTGTCAPTPPDTRVLFLGDSVDRTIIKHACQAVAGLQDSQARGFPVAGASNFPMQRV